MQTLQGLDQDFLGQLLSFRGMADAAHDNRIHRPFKPTGQLTKRLTVPVLSGADQLSDGQVLQRVFGHGRHNLLAVFITL